VWSFAARPSQHRAHQANSWTLCYRVLDGRNYRGEKEWELTGPREAKTDTRTLLTAARTLERSIAQTDLMVRRLVRYPVSLRSDVRCLDEAMSRLAKAQVRTEDNLAEATDKLNGLIDPLTQVCHGSGSQSL